jgi:hypothetical protein
MCNLYSMTTNQEAIRRLNKVVKVVPLSPPQKDGAVVRDKVPSFRARAAAGILSIGCMLGYRDAQSVTNRDPHAPQTDRRHGARRSRARTRALRESITVRSCLNLVLVVGCLAMAGCSEGPPSGPSGVLATPPQGGQPAVPIASAPTDLSGTYAGTAVPLNTGGGRCITTRNVSGFTVRGRSVRFGGFRGTIDANNGVQMSRGQQWIVGQFEGAIFYGQLDLTPQGTSRRGRSAPIGCSYILNLQRVGPS